MLIDPFWKGLFISAALNLLALTAALAVGVRAKLGGRAELGLATAMLWNILVMVPVYALGLTRHLDAGTLGWASGGWFTLVLAVARGRTPWGKLLGDIGRALGSLARLPVDALLITVRARSLAATGVLFAGAVLLWTFVCAYLTPSWKQWDALWYHEPMVGFAIQNHGFDIVDLPAGFVQKVNGYPRLCELTQLWFTIFMDRRVIDMVGHLAAPALALGVYALTRRYTPDRASAIAFGCAVVLMPASAMLLGSIYVDVPNAAFIIASAYFATRPVLRMRDALLAAVCLTLAVGSKSMALVPVGVLSLVVAVRLAWRVRHRPRETVATLAIGATLIGGMVATIYLRNWLHFGNPFWPDFKYDNDRLGIHWPGLVEWGSDRFERGSQRIDMNVPLSDFLRDLYRIPYSVARSSYGQAYEYGIGMAWLVFPLAVVALVGWCIAMGRDALARLKQRPDQRVAPETRNLGLLVLTLIAMIKFSPALWGARYQVAAVGIALAVVAWATGRSGTRWYAREVAGGLTVMSIIAFWWATPRYWLRWSEAARFAELPWPEREVTPAASISPELPVWNGSPVTQRAGLARERELGRGAVLAFSEEYGAYMALFWNNSFSNRIVYLPWSPDFPARAEQIGATWLYCATADSKCRTAVTARGSRWQEIGPLDVENRGSVYRRVR